MKLILLLAIALLLSSNVYAGTCENVEKLATVVMSSRQNGVPASILVAKSQGTPLKDLVTSLVTLAYSQPQYNTEKYQQKAITEFGSRAYVACLNAN